MNSNEAYKLYTTVSGPLGLLSAISCGLAAITSYVYPQQRKFPNIVIVWTCIGDCVLGLYVAMKYLPGPVRTNFTERAILHPALCYFSIYLQWTMLEVGAVLGLLLAFTLYALIVKKMDPADLNGKYYKVYLAVVWVPTLLIPLFCLAERSPLLNAGLCKIISPHTVIFRVCNLLLPLAIQFVLMAQVFKVTITVNLAVKNGLSKVDSKPIFWLIARFFGTQLNEIFVWLPIIYWDILNMNEIPASRAVTIIAAISPGFLTINGLIAMTGNRCLKQSIQDFINWLHFQIIRIPQFEKQVSSETRESLRTCESQGSRDSQNSIELREFHELQQPSETSK